MAKAKVSNKSTAKGDTEAPAVPKWQQGDPFTGEVPAYVLARETALKTEVRIVRFVERRRKYPSVLKTLYIGSREAITKCGLFLYPDDVRFPNGSKPTKPELIDDCPSARRHGLFKYSHDLFCLRIQDQLATRTHSEGGVQTFIFEEKGELEFTIYLGTKQSLADAKIQTEDWFPDDPEDNGYERRALGDSGPTTLESIRMPDGRWCYLVHQGNIEWAKRREEQEKTKQETCKEDLTVEQYRDRLLQFIDTFKNVLEEKATLDVKGATYRMPDDVIEEIRGSLNDVYWTIMEAVVFVRKHDMRSEDEKETARGRVMAAQVDSGFQSFLKSCVPIAEVCQH